MTIQTHDFSRPPSLHPEARSNLVQWLTRANSQLAEVIAGFGLQAEVKFEDCSTAWPFDSLQEWSEKTFAYRVKLADLSSSSVIALSNPLAQVLIGTLLGEQLEEWPEERELTPGEQSVGDFFVSTVVNCLIEAWTGDSPVPLKVEVPEPNLRRTNIFKFKEPFVVCRCNMTTTIGSAPWSWILPQEYIATMFGTVRNSEPQTTASVREQLESLAKDMTTQLSIRLGSVQLTAPQLAELRVGDRWS